MNRVRLLFIAAVLCVAPPLAATTIHTAEAPIVQNIRSLYAEAGRTFPSTDYYIDCDDLQRYSFSLLMLVEAREGVLLDEVSVWETRLAELIAEQEAVDPEDIDDEPGEILQVLVWPPPEDTIDIADPIEEHRALSPESELLALQDLRFRIETVLELFANRERRTQLFFTEQTVDVQGFINMPVTSYDLRSYMDRVNPFLSFSAGWGLPGGAAAELAFELRKSREDGLDLSNLPIAEDDSRFALSEDFLQRALLFYPLSGAYVIAGRFPVWTGPGQGNISYQSHAVDGLQIGTTAGPLSSRHVFLDSTVLHHVEWHTGALRIGIGSQNRFFRPDNQSLEVHEILPVIGAFLPDSETVVSQVLLDASWMMFPYSEFFFQMGMQRPSGGWEQADYSFAVFAGGDFLHKGPEADTAIKLELGWADADWGGSEGHSAEFFQVKDDAVYSNTSPYGPHKIWGNSDISVHLANTRVEIGFEFGFLYDASVEEDGLSGRTILRAIFIPDDIVSMELRPGIDVQKDGIHPQLSFRFAMRNRIQSQLR